MQDEEGGSERGHVILRALVEFESSRTLVIREKFWSGSDETKIHIKKNRCGTATSFGMRVVKGGSEFTTVNNRLSLFAKFHISNFSFQNL